MSDRIWNTPNQQDPWEACAEWEHWFAEQLINDDKVQEAWEEVDSWFKPQIYSVMCDLHDKLQAEIDRLIGLIKDIHKAKLILKGIDWEMEVRPDDHDFAVVNDLWNRIKQVYKESEGEK